MNESVELDENRLRAIERNARYLQDNELDTMEAAKRLGLIKGDAIALIRQL